MDPDAVALDELEGETVTTARYEYVTDTDGQRTREALVLTLANDVQLAFVASFEQGAGMIFGPYLYYDGKLIQRSTARA